jgi:predicted deacylase
VQGRATPAPPDEYASRYLTRVAVDHGKAACTPNFTGQWDIYEPEVRRGVAGLRAVLRHLGMLPQPSRRRAGAAPPVVFAPEDLLDVRVPDGGIFLPRARPEQRVRRGDLLGELVRLDGFGAEPVTAPVDALVHLVGAITPGADVALPAMMPVAPPGGRVARLLPVDAAGRPLRATRPPGG